MQYGSILLTAWHIEAATQHKWSVASLFSPIVTANVQGSGGRLLKVYTFSTKTQLWVLDPHRWHMDQSKNVLRIRRYVFNVYSEHNIDTDSCSCLNSLLIIIMCTNLCKELAVRWKMTVHHLLYPQWLVSVWTATAPYDSHNCFKQTTLSPTD